MVEERSRFLILPRSRTGLIHIPPGVVKSQGFPFKHEDEVRVSVRGERLIIEGGE